jgi:hypothetical protein
LAGQQPMDPAATNPSQAAATATSADVLQQMATSFAALQATITSGSSNVPHHKGSGDAVGLTFLVINTAGAVLIKRLQLGAALLL